MFFFRRGIFGLSFIVLGFFALWFLLWFLCSFYIERRLTNYISGLSSEGVHILCSDLDIIGFPFRFGVSCSEFNFRDDTRGIDLRASSVRSAAQFYDWTEHILEIDAPISLTTPDITINSDSFLRVYVDTSGSALTLLTANFSDISGEFDTSNFFISEGVFHIRSSPTSPDDLDIALTTTGFWFDFLGSPLSSDIFVDLTGVDFYRRLVEGWTSSRFFDSGFMIDLRALVIDPHDYASVLGFSGLLDINELGFLSGHLNIGLESGGDFLTRFDDDPSLTPLVTILNHVSILGRPEVFGDYTLRSVRLDFDDGNVRLGFLDFGRLPSLTH